MLTSNQTSKLKLLPEHHTTRLMHNFHACIHHSNVIQQLTATPSILSPPQTDNAAKRISQLLSNKDPRPTGIKLGVRTRGCNGLSYTMDYATEPVPAFEKVEDKGEKHKLRIGFSISFFSPLSSCWFIINFIYFFGHTLRRYDICRSKSTAAHYRNRNGLDRGWIAGGICV